MLVSISFFNDSTLLTMSFKSFISFSIDSAFALSSQNDGAVVICSLVSISFFFDEMSK